MPWQPQKTSSKGKDPIPEGIYDATIEDVDIVTNAAGYPEVSQNGKRQLKIKFLTSDGPVTMRCGESYGKSKDSGKWAMLTQVISAALGMSPDDDRKYRVTSRELIGKRVRIKVSINENNYNRVERVGAPGVGAGPTKHEPEPFDTGLPPEPDDELAPF
jgi:hypothetical protein